VLPILYLRGVSMGDFQEALGALLGRDAPNLSPAVVARLRDEWEADHARWRRRDLSTIRTQWRIGGRRSAADWRSG
jgi:hypothetical protein